MILLDCPKQFHSWAEQILIKVYQPHKDSIKSFKQIKDELNISNRLLLLFKIKKCLNVTRGVGKSYRENGGEKFITANTTLQVKRKSATEHTG